MECKAQVYFADIDESFAMIIEPLKSVSIQPSTSPVKLARSPFTDPPGGGSGHPQTLDSSFFAISS